GLGERVGEVGPHRDVLGEAARQREAQLVVVRAEVGLAAAAPGAGAAEVVALHRDTIPYRHPLHAGAGLLHRAAPLVAGGDRVPDVGLRTRALHDLDVAHAHAGEGDPDEDLPVADGGTRFV